MNSGQTRLYRLSCWHLKPTLLKTNHCSSGLLLVVQQTNRAERKQVPKTDLLNHRWYEQMEIQAPLMENFSCNTNRERERMNCTKYFILFPSSLSFPLSSFLLLLCSWQAELCSQLWCFESMATASVKGHASFKSWQPCADNQPAEWGDLAAEITFAIQSRGAVSLHNLTRTAKLFFSLHLSSYGLFLLQISTLLAFPFIPFLSFYLNSSRSPTLTTFRHIFLG